MIVLKDIKPEGIIYQEFFYQELQSYNQWKKFLWPTHWSWYKTIQRKKKLATGQGEDYTTGCLLDYDYIKNYYRATAVYLSKQKESDADRKAIHHIEFVGQLNETGNNDNATDAGADQAIFVLTVLGKIKKRDQNIFTEV